MLEQIVQTDQTILLWFNGGGSLFTDNLALLLTQGVAWIPLYLALFYLVVKNNQTMMQIVMVVGCAALCVALASGVDNMLVKPLVARPRPSLDPTFMYAVDVVRKYRESGFSFFSAHAANTMSVAVFFSLLVRSRMLTLSLLFWSLFNCWTRLYLGVHYPSDILAGMLWGALAGGVSYLVYVKCYYKFNPKINFISSHYTSTGYAAADIDVVMLALTVIFAVGMVVALYQM